MYHLRRLFIVVTILASFLQTQGASKYNDNDENRPYEFGFNIDGMQHRHEKKDENGLIQGEFGFITADGVYHVTVYATDENGGFKILSMKNIRLHPYPTSGTKQGHSLKLPPQDANHPPPPPPPQSQPVAPIKLEPPVKSCSHCSIPTTSTVAPKLNDFASVSQEQQPPFENNYQNNPQYPPNNPQYPENYPQHPSSNPQYSPNESQYPSNNPEYSPNDSQYPSNNAQDPNQQIDINSRFPEYPQENDIPHNQNELNNNYPKPQRNPKQFDDHNYAQPGFAPQNEPPQYPQNNDPAQKPVLINAQMQIVDRNTDINHLNPNERPGLPNGLHKGDMETLLYTFNYTVGFHGHHEEGYTNGAKKGYYFITGRNGIRTRVDYVADETGFHPKISQEVLDVLSDEVPKPETEKDEKYGLKGYEFKWLYYPENSKK